MKPETIRKTAVCHYSPKEGVYIVESPLLRICRGAADTEAEAWDIFDDILQAMYIKYLEGKQVARYRRGRPAKSMVNMHIQVQPESQDYINDLKHRLDCSQGEIIDFLIHFYRCKMAPEIKTTHIKSRRNARYA